MRLLTHFWLTAHPQQNDRWIFLSRLFGARLALAGVLLQIDDAVGLINDMGSQGRFDEVL